jgi:hypothetical protein
MTTFGLGIRDGGPLGIRPVADGWAVNATEAGEIAAVHRMCAALPGKAGGGPVTATDQRLAEAAAGAGAGGAGARRGSVFRLDEPH